MKRLLTILSMMLCFSMVVLESHAQSASESYNTGLAQMKKKQYAAAIKSFEASKIIDSSKANINKCNKQIKICQTNMKKAKGGDAPAKSAPVSLAINLEKESLEFKGDEMTQQDIKVEATESWTTSLLRMEDGFWCSAEKVNGGETLRITCKASDRTIDRSTTVTVKTAHDIKSVQVSQKRGAAVELGTDKTKLKAFSKKGGEEVLNIYSNSDTTYVDHYNWEIVEKPTWVKRLGTKAAETSAIDKFKNIFVKKTDTTLRERLHVNELSIKIEPNLSGKAREGNIVIRSQEAQLVILVKQKK